MEITTEVIKNLRDKTGVSIMQCKRALEEAGGDLGKAEVILKKRSASSADKKSDREIGSGTVGSYVHDGSIGAMVLLSCETDFVSKNPDFEMLARDIAMHISATNPTYTSSDEISDEAKVSAKAVFVEEVKDKPKEMQEQIIEGKLASYFKDQVLLDQPFIKDETKTIQELLNEAVQKFGERVVVSGFSRFSAR